MTRSKLSIKFNCSIGTISRKLRDSGLINYKVWIGDNSKEIYYREDSYVESKVIFTKYGENYIKDMLIKEEKDPKQISEIIGLMCPKPVIRCLKNLGVDVMGEYLKRKGVPVKCKGCGIKFKVKPSYKKRVRFLLKRV